MTVGNNTLDFTYDASGTPMSVTYGGSTYYYVTNLQGDVVAILNSSGTSVVTYTYDAWGRLLTTGGTKAADLGLYNPLRYRGYVYDTELGLYYLQNRYYNPSLGRFINADSVDYLGAGNNLTSYNLFVYCGNNPIMGYDPLGHWDWGWEDQLAFGTGVLIIGLALLLAGPTGGTSLTAGAWALASSTTLAAGAAATITGTVIVGEALSQADVSYAKKSRQSDKERSTKHPSWVSQSDVDLNKSAQENATELLNNKYGEGNWRKGPSSDFNQIVKWINRSLKAVTLIMLNMIAEE